MQSNPHRQRTRTSGARADPRRALGRLGEELAAAHLSRRGLAVIARNVRTRHGEIDLIACDGATLVFVEVKTRRQMGAMRGGAEQRPLEWLRSSQRARLRRLATAWLADARAGRPTARVIRFDAIGVIVDRDDRLLRLVHLEAAW